MSRGVSTLESSAPTARAYPDAVGWDAVVGAHPLDRPSVARGMRAAFHRHRVIICTGGRARWPWMPGVLLLLILQDCMTLAGQGHKPSLPKPRGISG